MRSLLCTCLAGLLVCIAPQAGSAALDGYHDEAALNAELARMAESPEAELLSIGKTAQGRPIHVLRIGGGTELLSATGEKMARPAIAVFGNVDATQLAGREACLGMAQRMLDSLDDDTALLEFLEQHDVFFCPSPSPDVTQWLLENGAMERRGNTRPVDDDADGRLDEDPGEDLNGDGLLTMMRVEDPAGDWMEHPDDPRVLIRVKREDNEQGRWRLLDEGTDNDRDEQWNEDGPGGVDFNRNLTFNYEEYGRGSGPWPVSEPETRSVVDWLFDNTQVCLVLSFSAEDNLHRPWKDDHGRLKFESAERDDLSVMEYISKQATELLGNEHVPDPATGRGGFADWAYFHYGAWSLCSRAWWLPEVKPAEPAPAEAEAAEGDKPEPKKPSDEKRGADELNALRWFAQEGVDGFAAWSVVDNPDFPGQRVEVGGFRPLLRDNPPSAMLDKIADDQFALLMKLATMLPKLEFREVEVEDLGEGLYRVTARVANMGYLPTSTQKAERIGKDSPINIAISLPPGASLLTGALRGRLGRIAGNGAWSEHAWLVVAPEGGTVSIVAASPSVGRVATTASLGQGSK